MKKNHLLRKPQHACLFGILQFSIFILLFASCTGRGIVKMSRSELDDKIRGGWAGQAIGCTYGGPTEFRWRGTVIPDEEVIPWPEGYIKEVYDNNPNLYDDLYMDLTVLDVFDRLGLDAPLDSFTQAFAHADYMLWHANQAARFNIFRGMKAPETGHWKNNPHADDIDYQIEADYAGLLCPGMPNSASTISDSIGHIMNYGDGWYGGIFVGAMYAEAFIQTDIATVISEALKTIPAESRFYQCMADVIRCHAQWPDDWKQTWQYCQDNYADEQGCPEGVLDPLDIDALINSAYIVISLLYGEGDFARTIDIATRCGQDSDCNPSSAGGILGCLLGYEAIPDEWKANLEEVEDRPLQYTTTSLRDACAITSRLALETIVRGGGKVSDKAVRICTQQPQAVRYEKSFEGVQYKEVLEGRQLADFDTLRFEGCGIVVRCDARCPNDQYVAEVAVILDGDSIETVTAPVAYHDRAQELCWYYDLPEGPHSLAFRWLNPQPDASVNCYRIITYQTSKN